MSRKIKAASNCLSFTFKRGHLDDALLCLKLAPFSLLCKVPPSVNSHSFFGPFGIFQSPVLELRWWKWGQDDPLRCDMLHWSEVYRAHLILLLLRSLFSFSPTPFDTLLFLSLLYALMCSATALCFFFVKGVVVNIHCFSQRLQMIDCHFLHYFMPFFPPSKVVRCFIASNGHTVVFIYFHP